MEFIPAVGLTTTWQGTKKLLDIFCRRLLQMSNGVHSSCWTDHSMARNQKATELITANEASWHATADKHLKTSRLSWNNRQEERTTT
jgi:hypothetical protein